MMSTPTWAAKVRTVVVIVGISLFLSGCNSASNSGLQVQTGDIPASVHLDGKFAEKTPYVNRELKPGEYSLEIRPDDTSFVTYQTKVSLKRGMLTVVDWQPGKRPETSGGVIYETEPLREKTATEFLITTIPDGGIVYVDGEAKGFAPVTITNLAKGEHSFEVKLPSYTTQTHPINILEGYRIIATVKLGKQDYQAQPTPAASSSAINTASAAANTNSGAAQTASGSATNVPRPRAIIRQTNFFQAGKEVLRVRADANSSAREVGFAPVGQAYPYLKESKNGWVKIQFNGAPGWISQQFTAIEE
jgi:hypothetical protein